MRSSIRRLSRLASLLAVLALVPGVATGAEEDPYRPQQYGLDQVRAPEAWLRSTGQRQVVAIVDSGVDLEHPDLLDKLLRDRDGRVIGYDFVDDDDVPADENGHGTMVAGIVGAETGNGIGTAGAAPAALLMPVRVLDEDGAGRSSDVDAGIRWAVDHGASVVNLSLESVATLPGAVVSQAPADAVRYAWDHGVVVVAAAGNSGSPFTDYPSASKVVLVGATNRDGERAEFSDTGRTDAIMAPGVDIVSTWWCPPDDERCGGQTHTYGEAEGTSFAAPFVSATAAMLRALGHDAQGTVDRMRETARDLGMPGPDPETGYGLLDAAAAVSSPAPVSPKPSPSPSPSSTPEPDTTNAADDQPTSVPRPSPSPAPPIGSATPAPVPTGTPAPPAASPTADPSPEVAPPAASPMPTDAAGEPAGAPSPSRARSLRILAAILVVATAVALIALSRDEFDG